MKNRIAPWAVAAVCFAAVSAFAGGADFESLSDASQIFAQAKEAAQGEAAPAGVSAEVSEALSKCEPGITSRYSYGGNDVTLGYVSNRNQKTAVVSGDVAITSCERGAFGRGTLKGRVTAELGREFAKPGDEGDGDIFGTIRLEDAHGRYVGDLAVKGHAWAKLQCYVWGSRGGGGVNCYLKGNISVWNEEFHAPGTLSDK